MSDSELERLRRQRLTQLSKRLQAKKEEKEETVSRQDLLNKVFIGRAWEVFKAIQAQHPQFAERLGDVLAQLVSSGKIKRVSGQDLYTILRREGLRVRLKTTIRIKEHGKLRSLEEKIRDDMPSRRSD